MKKDIILIILITLHLFFIVSIIRLPSINNTINNNNNINNDKKDNIMHHQQNINEANLFKKDSSIENVVKSTPLPTTIKKKQNDNIILNNNNKNKEEINIDIINKEETNNKNEQKNIEIINNSSNNRNNTNINNKLKNKNIYVTFTNNVQYIKGIIALRMSMIKNDCKYGLIVFVTKEVPEEERKPLYLLDCDVREIEMVDIPPEVNVQIERWRPAFTKFRAWKLVEFEKVIWLDSDMLLMKSLDHLFDLVDVSNPKLLYAAIDADANSCQYKPERLKLINSGIMVLSPSEDVYNILIDGMVLVSKIPNQLTVNDQDVINVTLSDWRALSYPEYGVQINHCECEDSRLWNFQSTYFIHYTAGLKELPKPWKLLNLSSNQANDLLSPMPKCIQQLYHTWLETYSGAMDQIDNIVKLMK